METKKALNNLVDITETLKILNLTSFLIDGTLLGYVRENDFISHDTDTDLGVYMEEWTEEKLELAERLLNEKGFKKLHSFGIFGEHFEVAFSRDGIKTDLFFYYKHKELKEIDLQKENEKYKKVIKEYENRDKFYKEDFLKIETVYCIMSNKRRFNAFLNGGRTLPDDILTYEYESDLIDNLKEVEWKGFTFKIPKEPEKVLIAKYGENWKIPDINWRWDFSPKNLISEDKYL